MRNDIHAPDVVDLLRRAQSFASTVSIFEGKDPDYLHLLKLEASSLRDAIHAVCEKLEKGPRNLLHDGDCSIWTGCEICDCGALREFMRSGAGTDDEVANELWAKQECAIDKLVHPDRYVQS